LESTFYQSPEKKRREKRLRRAVGSEADHIRKRVRTFFFPSREKESVKHEERKIKKKKGNCVARKREE